MKRFAQYILDRPKKLILLSILAIGALIPGIFKLEGQFDHKIWFREDDPYLLEFKDFERKFGNDDAVIFIMSHPDGIFTKERLQTIKEITEDFWQVPEIIRVDSLSNYNWVHAEVVDGEEELVVELDLKRTFRKI